MQIVEAEPKGTNMEISMELRSRLLTSIENGTLLILCGAGLSMPSPSSLPSAYQIAEQIYNKLSASDPIDPKFKNDLCAIANYFLNMSQESFVSGFIDRVPWKVFLGEPNEGHKTLADFLLCNVVRAVLSTNYDVMIEKWISDNLEDFRAALDGDEADRFEKFHRPLIKIHGCANRDRENTIWSPEQLNSETIKRRIASIAVWINSNLRNKDLVVIGFSSDWAYLNKIIESCLKVTELKSVSVVDPANSSMLKEKAENFWNILSKNKNFEHIPYGSEDFLKYLREEYSKVWMKKFYQLASRDDRDNKEEYHFPVDSYNYEQLCDLRKDIEGIDYSCMSRKKWADEESSISISYAHKKLFESGAKLEGTWFTFKGKRIRVINALGRNINDLPNLFDQPTVTEVDIVICAGADGNKLKESMLEEEPKTRWLSIKEAFKELGIC